MKKISIAASIILSLIYVASYLANVSELVSLHTDDQLFIPIIVMLISVLLVVVMAIINKVKVVDRKMYIIPAAFFAASVLTLAVGYYTPCAHCSI